MGRERWKQIHWYFHVWDPALDHSASNRTARPYEKVNPFAKLLLTAFQRYWKPATDITIDECIEGFTGRSKDTVYIPTKPNPIRFKIWVLADQGYMFDLLWHVKGDGKDQGPQGLRIIWEKKGFSKTQAVILELIRTSNSENHKKSTADVKKHTIPLISLSIITISNHNNTHVTVTMIKHAVEMLQVYALAGVQFED